MSMELMPVIVCDADPGDGDECGETAPDPSSFSEDYSRRIAHRYGWTTVDGEDFCPRHSVVETDVSEEAGRV